MRKIDNYIEQNGYKCLIKKKDKPFKILQITDIHMGCGFLSRKKDKLAEDSIRRIIENSDPDMIVLTGDQIYPIPIFSGTINNLKQTKKVASIIESYKIPWACVYGNHDVESFAKYDKTKLSEFYESLEYCMFSRGPEEIYGQGNYAIRILNEDLTINRVLYMLDSNMYLTNSFFSGFDHVHDCQINWYKEEVKKSEKELGTIPQSFMFFHIPCSEYKIAWREYTDGNKNNDVVYYFGEIGETNDYFGVPRKEKTKIFDAVKEMKSTVGIFCGHDHLNTASYSYKGIRLTYGHSIDFLAYAGILKHTNQRGGTILELKEGNDFDIYPIKLKDLGGYVNKNKWL